MTVGSGIAIAGIWIGVGVCAFAMGPWAVLVALFAMHATSFVASTS